MTKTYTETELNEINRKIAERVMGLTRNKFINPMPKAGEYYLHQLNGVLIEFDKTRQTCVFSPTTDPAAAMAVLQKCFEKRSTFSVTQTFPNEFFVEREKAKTLPIAICLFALKLFPETK